MLLNLLNRQFAVARVSGTSEQAELLEFVSSDASQGAVPSWVRMFVCLGQGEARGCWCCRKSCLRNHNSVLVNNAVLLIALEASPASPSATAGAATCLDGHSGELCQNMGLLPREVE